MTFFFMFIVTFGASRDKWARFQRQILAIDALNYKHKEDQYSMINVTRELNKVKFALF